ncbi:MAG: NAD(+) diphosphatase [Ruminiclostridium sp.]|jgi:NAD+ diphosphatase|nr:NAD(+) diphosphatase [Ruminiclostridium sp.]
MLQEIEPKQYHVEYSLRQPEADSLCFVFQGRKALERVQDGSFALPTYRELRAEMKQVFYLFRIDGEEYYLAELEEGTQLPGYDWQDLRKDREKKDKAFHFAETTAYHLSLWYRDNKFCGRCGGETQPDQDERMLRCPRCGNMIYPKIAPAVIVAVTDGDRLLMTRYQGREYKGYALIAGFNEIGETAEDTVRREIREEVGLEVKDIRYYGSQPWGTESNLLLGFFARLDGDGTIHMDRQELSQAGWYRREEIPVKPDEYSLTNHMIQAFLRGQWT